MNVSSQNTEQLHAVNTPYRLDGSIVQPGIMRGRLDYSCGLLTPPNLEVHKSHTEV